MEERQEEADHRSLSVYRRQRDYHHQQARQYKTFFKNEKLDLERAKERYSEVKREFYSDTKRYRRRLDLYKNQVENAETNIEMYKNKVEYHKGRAKDYQHKIDRI